MSHSDELLSAGRYFILLVAGVASGAWRVACSEAVRVSDGGSWQCRIQFQQTPSEHASVVRTFIFYFLVMPNAPPP